MYGLGSLRLGEGLVVLRFSMFRILSSGDLISGLTANGDWGWSYVDPSLNSGSCWISFFYEGVVLFWGLPKWALGLWGVGLRVFGVTVGALRIRLVFGGKLTIIT